MPRRCLTDREQRVARLVAKGLGNREITQAVQISLPATKRCISHIMLKWDCTNRTQIAMEALRRGIASIEPDPLPNSHINESEQPASVHSEIGRRAPESVA